ncbi:MAG TPA: hypothetical protein VHF47_05835 [Acidimicrobiales bacterium]|nr:hypothetical protein [Acidimicrobiales bacterium]
MKLFRTRPRRAAVAIFALGGAVVGVGGAMVPAQATHDSAPPRCNRVSVWTYKSQQGKEYVVEEQCIGPALFPDRMNAPVGHEDDTQPKGTTTGAGVKVWLTWPGVP